MKLFQKLACALAIMCVTGTISPTQAEVKLTQGDDTVSITINGREFSTFNYSQELPKPFMSPVKGAGGEILTRPIYFDRKGGDHPHHKGIFVAVDEVGGVKFWAEAGKISNKSVTIKKAVGNPARLDYINEWQRADGKAVVVESTAIHIWDNGLMAYDIRFKAGGDERVEFGDTKEGLFGFRMAETMKEKEGGTVVSSTGAKGTAATWGKVQDWIDYYGKVNGKTYGVALFDHPLNFRRSRYHVRNYGLFSINPFGESAYTGRRRPAEPYYLDPAGTLRLRYAIYIHSGTTEDAQVGNVYLSYLKSGR